jgi:hypothetical protein
MIESSSSEKSQIKIGRNNIVINVLHTEQTNENTRFRFRAKTIEDDSILLVNHANSFQEASRYIVSIAIKYLAKRKRAIKCIEKNSQKFICFIRQVIILKHKIKKKRFSRIIAHYRKKHYNPQYDIRSRSALLIQKTYKKYQIKKSRPYNYTLLESYRISYVMHKSKMRFKLWKTTANLDLKVLTQSLRSTLRINDLQQYIYHNFHKFKVQLRQYYEVFKEHFRKHFDYSNWEGIVDSQNRLCWSNNREGIVLYEMPYMHCYKKSLKIIKRESSSPIKTLASIIYSIIYMMKLQIIDFIETHNKLANRTRLMYIEKYYYFIDADYTIVVDILGAWKYFLNLILSI